MKNAYRELPLIFTANFWKLIAIRDSRWLNSRPAYGAGLLTRFISLVSFCTSCNYRKTKGFHMFSGGIERNQWYEMC